MARYTNPAVQYLDNNGDPVINGKLYFYKSSTNTPIVTYKDDSEIIPNTHPIILDEAGRTPNIFYSGSARVVLHDANDVLIFDRDPVGGEKELGDFTLWDNVVIYDLNDIVEGSDGKFYISISASNQGNDPTSNPSNWSEIRFIGVWNSAEPYSVGDVVQISDGSLFKAVTANTGNDPSIDSGTNWLPAINGDIKGLLERETWANKAADFTLAVNTKYQIDGSGGTVDATLPATIATGDFFIVHNESVSTNLVRIVNTGAYTIKGPSGTITTADNLVLEAGDTAHLVAKSITILEIV